MKQSEIRDCVTFAVAKFKEIMPPLKTPYPEVYVSTAKTYKGLRAKIMKELDAPEPEAKGAEYIMELFCGLKGNAFLLKSDLIHNHVTSEALRSLVWQNMGAIYAAVDSGADLSSDSWAEDGTEKDTSADSKIKTKKRKSKNKPTDEEVRSFLMHGGRNFWYRFAAVAIGNYIADKVNDKEPGENAAKGAAKRGAKESAKESATGNWDKRDWPFEEWAPLSEFMAKSLRYIFKPMNDAKDEFYHDDDMAVEYSKKVNDQDLAAFFANLLTDSKITAYTKAAEERRLVISNSDLHVRLRCAAKEAAKDTLKSVEKGTKKGAREYKGDKGVKPDEFFKAYRVYVTEDPTHFSELDCSLQIPLWQMGAVLEDQLKNERFWRADAALLENLGLLTGELHGRICTVIVQAWKRDEE